MKCTNSNNPNSRAIQPNGFTLMELLIVISIILILMLMAIPTMGNMKKHASETSAIQSIKAINMAELQYDSMYPANGYSCKLAALGGETSSGPPSPTAAQMLQSDLASGYKSGYIFEISNCKTVSINGTDRVTGYTLTAVPQTVGQTGNRGFCSDEGGGTPKYDPAGGKNCTQLLQ
ncbi:MAG: prepilin-type N-terminal cleavage/methylation domain-containing protein [Terracidiphilus sp.]|jgi:type IV pilus assembly protein PilA